MSLDGDFVDWGVLMRSGKSMRDTCGGGCGGWEGKRIGFRGTSWSTCCACRLVLSVASLPMLSSSASVASGSDVVSGLGRFAGGGVRLRGEREGGIDVDRGWRNRVTNDGLRAVSSREGWMSPPLAVRICVPKGAQFKLDVQLCSV